MQAFTVNLASVDSAGGETVTVDLGTRRTFYAWCQITVIDSLADFDRDNAAAIDIVRVDGTLTPWRAAGGDHFGPPGAVSNVRESAMSGAGQRITFRLRAFHKADLAVLGVGMVLVP
ncbi:hypothetical protein H0B56_00705 [Haloechinothrix sp. YIM 98757]|uniref:F5/8 type C domain-containing protein n=1 Tax=Haloechinothrix aidingensis TaxID=2752311 RepID=A0A838A530_9PSEU|nr:hypothetical protein [Haloechinothrix aidingensis]MBA0124058.1 hypothetical protein [Haloechinothrix aidingensis]